MKYTYVLKKIDKTAKWKVIVEDWEVIISFLKKNQPTAFIPIFINTTIVIMTALDSIEVVFSVGPLGLTEKKYGLLVSITGVGVLLGSALTLTLNATWNNLIGIHVGSILTARGYGIYSISENFFVATIGFFCISFSQAFVNVSFYSFLQKNCPTDLLGRFISVFAMYESVTGLLVIIVVGLATQYFPIRYIIIILSFLFMIVCVLVKSWNVEKK